MVMPSFAAWPPELMHKSTERGLFVYVPYLRMGGAELSMVRLAAGFAQRGVPVTLVVHEQQDRGIDVPPGVELVTLGTGRSLGALWHLAWLLRQRRPSVMLTAFPHTNVVAVASRLLAGLFASIDCRLVISEHAPLSRQVTHMGGWRYRLLPLLTRWAYPRADAVVAVSNGVRDDLNGLMAGIEPRVIHNPVLPADWAARAREPVAHPWLRDPFHDVVLTVSRLSAEKDISTLVTAFAAVNTQWPSARLLIAGDGPERASIEACISALGLQSVVQLTGVIRNPLSWMRRARVFVLASRFEGFGNVLVEALAVGTQVVSTDCPVGPREVLEGGRLGSLVPVGDARAMSQAILTALEQVRADEAPVTPSMAQGVARHYSADLACSRYLALFDELGATGLLPVIA
jgi:glycosyltransferase involved in cell wall biosynthesis